MYGGASYGGAAYGGTVDPVVVSLTPSLTANAPVTTVAVADGVEATTITMNASVVAVGGGVAADTPTVTGAVSPTVAGLGLVTAAPSVTAAIAPSALVAAKVLHAYGVEGEFDIDYAVEGNTDGL